ncbi:MAG: hypothetical protein RL291_1715, partial [Pseudomonadota bacterium]
LELRDLLRFARDLGWAGGGVKAMVSTPHRVSGAATENVADRTGERDPAHPRLPSDLATGGLGDVGDDLLGDDLDLGVRHGPLDGL